VRSKDLDKTSDLPQGETAVDQSEMVIRASKWFPFGGLLFGLVFCGTAALFVGAWWPVIWYLVPWSVHAIMHYLNQKRFLREAVWCMRIKVTGQTIVFVFSPSLAVYAILIEWYGLYYGIGTSLIYTALLYRYFQIYLERTCSAWEERRTSNYRFALDPDTRTFRFDQGFNFGPIPGMWWDNMIFGTLLTLTTFSGALIGDMAGDLGIRNPVTLVTGGLMSLLAIRWLITREIVSLQKIQAYEQEHGVTIRPR
jgi:hypothetical protein